MLTARTAWGLDIGESTIKAVKVRRTKTGAEILAFDSIERSLPSEDTGDKDYHLRTAVSELAERNAFGRTPVVASIPEPAFSRFIPLPPVDKRRIPEVVRYEARQQIPFPIEEVVWDYQLVREPQEIGEETEVAIFSLRSQFVYSLIANLSLCKVQASAVLPVPLALYNYLTFDRDIAKGTIVVDLGAGSTDILICDPENFRVRNISVSGNGITRGLSERLKITQAEAEALKRESGNKVQAKRLLKLIQPTLNDLAGQVQRTIGFFKSQIHKSSRRCCWAARSSCRAFRNSSSINSAATCCPRTNSSASRWRLTSTARRYARPCRRWPLPSASLCRASGRGTCRSTSCRVRCCSARKSPRSERTRRPR